MNSLILIEDSFPSISEDIENNGNNDNNENIENKTSYYDVIKIIIEVCQPMIEIFPIEFKNVIEN